MRENAESIPKVKESNATKGTLWKHDSCYNVKNELETVTREVKRPDPKLLQQARQEVAVI